MLDTKAIGHGCTYGKGISREDIDSSTNQRAGSRPQAAASMHRLEIEPPVRERIGLRFDPQAHPYEYVSERRRLSTHELLYLRKLRHGLGGRAGACSFCLPLDKLGTGGRAVRYSLYVCFLRVVRKNSRIVLLARRRKISDAIH